jgi:Holliday junction resolvase RusA-like endonuclease
VTLRFFAAGKPEPQGSSKGFVVTDKRTGRPRAIITSDNAKLRPWRASVQYGAQLALEEAGLFGQLVETSVFVDARFTLPTPKWAEAKLRKGTAVACVTRPDLDKLARALLDALTGLVFADDSQVVGLHVRKAYAQPGAQPGVQVVITADLAAPAVATGALPLDEATP